MSHTRMLPRVSVPTSWRRRTDPGCGVVVAARCATLPPSGVPPELVLHVTEPVTDELEAWRRTALHELAGLLDSLAVEDDDLYELDGHLVVYHRFAHRLGSADVICDQWSWLLGGVGVTLTCSVAREDYPDYCDVFEDLATTVELDSRAA